MAEDETTPLLRERCPSLNGGIVPNFNDDEQYIVYKRRWFILGVLCLLNISNAMIWITFASIADITTSYYSVTSSHVDWLSLVYLVAAIPCGLSATWVIDALGLRASIVLGSWLNCIGCVIRLASAYVLVSETKWPLVITGQTIAACAQPFALFAPTKLAALWFRGNQRVTANMLASMSNPLGILLANVLSPVIASSNGGIPILLAVYTIPAGLVLLLATFGVCSSTPPTPPTSSAAEDSQPFLQGVKSLVKNKDYWVLALCFGIGMAAFTACTTLLEQVLCARGYEDLFSGVCGGLLIGVGIIGAGLAGFIVDRTKMFDEIIKICYCLAALGAVFFTVTTLWTASSALRALVAISVSFFGFFGFAIYPLCLEVGVEITYPVAEGTSAGLILVAGQIIGIGLILIMQVSATELTPLEKEYSLCAHTKGVVPHNFTVPNTILCGFVVVGAIVLAIFFRPQYKRLHAEQQLAAERILQYDAQNRDN